MSLGEEASGKEEKEVNCAGRKGLENRLVPVSSQRTALADAPGLCKGAL